MGCDSALNSKTWLDFYFNPRTHVGCDCPKARGEPPRLYFNPRTHVGCDAQWSRLPGEPVFQSTHPRGVRRSQDIKLHGGTPISIHAPTWGATLVSVVKSHIGVISIHAPTWGATVKSRHAVRQVLISIHAPTWGATLFLRSSGDTHRFQSTHPRGVRRISTCSAVVLFYFNPRTHVGCDLHGGGHIAHRLRISIHAPTWGATLRFWGHRSRHLISIHAPTWGATSYLVFFPQLDVISIHAPTWGATPYDGRPRRRPGISIHAPTWGATRNIEFFD